MKNILYLFFAITLLGCGSDDATNLPEEAPVDVNPNCTSVVQNYVTIGSQIWSTNNLDVTTYCDGTEIPQVDSDANNSNEWASLKTGAWTYSKNCNCGASYTFTESELHSFGKLYNKYAVAGIHDEDPNTPNKQLAPDGWLVPTSGDFNILFSNNDAPSLRTTGTTEDGSGLWLGNGSDFNLGTNTTGFSALPAGFKGALQANQNGGYGNAGYTQSFWTSEDILQNNRANHVIISTLSEPNDFYFIDSDLRVGLSVRLIKSQ